MLSCIWCEFIDPKYCNNPCEFWLALLLATQNKRALKNLAFFVYKAFSRRKLCYREELEDDMRYIQDEDELRNKKAIITILLYIRFRFGFAHLQHSNVSNLNVVCVHCIIRFVVLTPLQMGLWPYWIKFLYSVFRILSLFESQYNA